MAKHKAASRKRASARKVSYPKGAPEQPYAVREPTTGLYAVFGAPGFKPAARLDYQRNASRFATSSDALVAVSVAGLNSQPHELVRIDA
jgi:hypothetical protein